MQLKTAMERRKSTIGDSDTVAAVTLSQMVDMALGNPEVGIVRFNILQSLLHAILQTLGIGDVEALYEVAHVPKAELPNAAATSPQDDVAPHGPLLHKKSSSLNLPMLHIVMPAPATFELMPSPGTPFLEMADKVKKLEVRFERLYRPPSNEELFKETGVNSVGEGAVAGMWQNMKLLGRVEAYGEGMKEVMTLVNNLFQENTKHWDETQSVKEQLENVSRIINTEMEVPSFVTWSSLEEILKGVENPLQKPFGPSTALKDQMKTIGKADHDVIVLDEKCQVLDEKVHEHSISLKRLDPAVTNLVSTMKATSGELSNFLKLRKSQHSDLKITETDDKSADDDESFDNLIGNVRQLVSEADENLNKIQERLNSSGASVEKRLLALEQAITSLREVVKAQAFDWKLSASNIELSQMARLPGGVIEAVLSRDLEAADLALPTSSVSEGSKVGKPIVTSQLSVPISSAKKKVPDNIHEIDAKLGQFGRKMKLQLKQDKTKMEELESKLHEVADHVKKLRATVSCDGAEEGSCLRVMQRSIDQLQVDVRKVTEMGLEAKLLADKVEQIEVSQDTMLSGLADASAKFIQLESAIADFDRKMQAEELVWNEFLASITGRLDDSLRTVHLEMVTVRKDVQCHLRRLNDDVGQLHLFLDEFGDDGAGTRRKLKFQCLSCDRKLLVTPLEPPSDSCPAQTGFQSSLSAHPYTSFEMENIRNRQKTCLLPKQLTNFQRAILERHMARLRMRDFRSYFMQCVNDLPEVQTAKSTKCSTLYEKEATLPDVYSRLSRSSGGQTYMSLPPSSGLVNANYGNKKGVEFVDAFNLAQTTSVNTVGNKSSVFASVKPPVNTSLTKKHRDAQLAFHARRSLSRGKGSTKCRKLLTPEDTQDANLATCGDFPFDDQQPQQLSPILDGTADYPKMSPENLL